MTPTAAKEFLKRFDQTKLKEQKVCKITEFYSPEARTGIISVRSKIKDLFVDIDGRIVEYKMQVNDKIQGWQQYEYNANDDLILVKEFLYNKNRGGNKWTCRSTAIDTTKQYGASFITEKDENGNTVVTTFHSNGVLQRQFRYDAYNNLIRFIYQVKTGKITTDQKLFYDSDNNLIETVDIPKSMYTLLPAIDLDRLATEDSQESYRHKYYYDCNGLLFEHQIYLAGQFAIVYEYEYESREASYVLTYPKC